MIAAAGAYLSPYQQPPLEPPAALLRGPRRSIPPGRAAGGAERTWPRRARRHLLRCSQGAANFPPICSTTIRKLQFASSPDLTHLLRPLVNRGFPEHAADRLLPRRQCLEKLMRLQAVHEIKGLDDLRGVLVRPTAVRFACCHPALSRRAVLISSSALWQVSWPHSMSPRLHVLRI